jgi:hypothetical protein
MWMVFVCFLCTLTYDIRILFFSGGETASGLLQNGRSVAGAMIDCRLILFSLFVDEPILKVSDKKK